MEKIKKENEKLLKENNQKNEEIIKLQKKLLKIMDINTLNAVNKILMEQN